LVQVQNTPTSRAQRASAAPCPINPSSTGAGSQGVVDADANRSSGGATMFGTALKRRRLDDWWPRKGV